MKIIAGIVLFGLLCTVAPAQEKQSPGMDEMMKKMAEASTPGPMQKKLDVFAGSWNIKSSFWMGGADKQPVTSTGTAEFKWILGGRFMQQEFSGDVMGQTMHGMGLNGYDNIRKKYTMFWVDDMGTIMTTGDGNFDQSGKVMTLYGKMDEPITGEFDKNVAYITRVIDNDKFVFEIHDLSLGGNSTKTMEMEYTRKK